MKKNLEARHEQLSPTDCITETRKLRLESSNSVFNNKHFLRTDITAQSPHVSCSYSDITIESFDKKALH